MSYISVSHFSLLLDSKVIWVTICKAIGHTTKGLQIGFCARKDIEAGCFGHDLISTLLTLPGS